MVYFSTVLSQASEPVYTNLQAEQLSSALLLTAYTAAHSKHMLEYHIGVCRLQPSLGLYCMRLSHSHRARIWFCTQKCKSNYLPSTACYLSSQVLCSHQCYLAFFSYKVLFQHQQVHSFLPFLCVCSPS